jgi:hypothetical protein
LAGIRKLPHTLCHHDAFRRNLIAGKDQQENDVTFALDWSMLGIGVIGEEAATMLTVSMQLLDIDMAFAAQLERLIFDGYLVGLRDTGWSGKSELVRFGFCSSAFLFMALGGAGSWMPWIVDDSHHKDTETFIGHPIESVMVQWSKMQTYLLDLADEALSMNEFVG